MLFLESDQPFATGRAAYEYRPVHETDPGARLLVRVLLEGVLTLAAVDTGAPYVICSPALARQLSLDQAASLSSVRVVVRGVSIPGNLYRLNLVFPAEQGEDLDLDATAFVPAREWEDLWGNLPSFLGLTGCLERLRFAVDPSKDWFYFGPLP